MISFFFLWLFETVGYAGLIPPTALLLSLLHAGIGLYTLPFICSLVSSFTHGKFIDVSRFQMLEFLSFYFKILCSEKNRLKPFDS